MEMIGKEEDLFFGGLLLHAAKAIIYQISKNWCWFHSFILFDKYVINHISPRWSVFHSYQKPLNINFLSCWYLLKVLIIMQSWYFSAEKIQAA